MILGRVIPLVLSLALTGVAVAQQSIRAEADAPLTLEQVLTNIEQRDAQRAAALQQFEGKRTYRMRYRGFAGDKDAEMVVKVTFHAPNTKEFTVVSETGSRFAIDHVFKKLLEGEQEAAAGENRRGTALTRENYEFELEAFHSAPNGGQYVLKLLPKTKNRFLYRGKIWVDANDFAVVRIEGEPGKNPSMWIKKTDIAQRYVKIGNFWLPAENRTESSIRLGGRATLSIKYEDYRIIKSAPFRAPKNGGPSGDAILPSLADDSANWISRVARNGSQ